MWKLLCLLAPAIAILCCVSTSSAQYKPPRFKNFVKEDGLSSTDITSIAQTPDGYLWVGTSDGLNRFDGYEFVVYRTDPQQANSIADNNITCLHVDKTGSLWIGTRTSGLSRYSSTTGKFKNYKSISYDKTTLSNYYIMDMAEDTAGNLWVATAMGLNKYIPEKDIFERHFHQASITINAVTIDSLQRYAEPPVVDKIAKLAGKPFSDEEALDKALIKVLTEEQMLRIKPALLRSALLQITADKIKALEADSHGDLWFGYQNNGLARFTPSTKVLQMFSSGTQPGFWDKEIRSLFYDGKDLWIGTRDGHLAFFDLNERKLTSVKIPGESNNIETITKDSNGNLWVGDDYGLCLISKDAKTIQRYQHEDGNKYSLVTSSAKVIFEDQYKNLWVGCAQGGLSLSVTNTLFDHYKHDLSASISLSKNHVSSVLEDSHGNVWIGYFTMGIDVWNKKTGRITHYNYDPEKSDGLGRGTVFTIFEDYQGVIWIGTYEGGLQYLDRITGKFHSLRYDEKDTTSISGNDVRAITQDKSGDLWVAVHGHGINKIDRKSLKVQRFYADYDNIFNALANDWVYTIYADRQDNIWVGTVFGFSVLYKDASHFVSYNRQNSDLSHDHVRTITEDAEGMLWFGTHHGLSRFDPKTNKITIYNQKNGLPNSIIHGVLHDDQGNLWISTNNGLSRLDYKQNKVLNFTDLDGLQGPEFSSASCYKGKSGAMYFGGTNGLNVFYPQAITTDGKEIPVIFTSLTLFNQPVSSETAMLKGTINTAKEIVFESNQNVFSISFVGLSFKDSDKIQYAYQLEGFDNAWTYVKSRREVTYTNLDPGSYTFKVLAANSSGVWNKTPKSIRIVVQPPLWKTPWAYTVYTIMIILSLYIYRKTNIARERLKNDVRLKALEVQKTQELNALKLKFFTNISHEFKTPLTLINGPIESLMNKDASLTESKRSEFYELIHRNAQRLLRLINQLLDMSAIDAGFMKLKVAKSDVVEFCKNITETFSYATSASGIQYTCSSNVSKAEVYFDHDKLEKILYNLVSNAVKFTPSGGSITVSLNVLEGNDARVPNAFPKNVSGRYMLIEVTDTGIGIPDGIAEKVFERFYQAESGVSNKNGTGIGLALTRQLVERHYGSISLASEEGKGCRVTVWLPVSKNHFRADEIVDFADLRDEVKQMPEIFMQQHQTGAFNSLHEADKTLPMVLVVEDNDDVRRYLALSLANEYNVYESASGKAGFEKAVEINPDLILSDVVMPDGSGFELCEQVRTDKRTSHIPFVLLSARSADHFQLEGLNFGADDYITKPFNAAIVKARIRNIIQSRRKIQDKFYSDLNFDPANLASNAADKSFVNQLLSNIEANLTDENFNPDTLADNLHVSRSQLYKKVKGLTGLSVSLFIRSIRLRRAAQMLKANSLTVSEVAYEVGFSDPGYFTKCFKEAYSKSPTEFMKDPVDV